MSSGRMFSGKRRINLNSNEVIQPADGLSVLSDVAEKHQKSNVIFRSVSKIEQTKVPLIATYKIGAFSSRRINFKFDRPRSTEHDINSLSKRQKI